MLQCFVSKFEVIQQDCDRDPGGAVSRAYERAEEAHANGSVRVQGHHYKLATRSSFMRSRHYHVDLSDQGGVIDVLGARR